MDVYHKILEKYWGYPAFRPLQEDIIHSVCAGKDTLGLMPTGGGKSITFQVPALAMEGICIVVTPLDRLDERPSGELTPGRHQGYGYLFGHEPARDYHATGELYLRRV